MHYTIVRPRVPHDGPRMTADELELRDTRLVFSIIRGSSQLWIHRSADVDGRGINASCDEGWEEAIVARQPIVQMQTR